MQSLDCPMPPPILNGKLSAEKQFMKQQVLSFLAVCDFKLPLHRFPVDANAHGGYFECGIDGRIPENYIPVQSVVPVIIKRTPVVIIRSPAVMRFTVAQLIADSDDKDSAMFFCRFPFPLPRCKIRDIA